MHLFVMGCTRPGLPVHMIRPGRPYVWDCGSIYPQDRREETMPQAPFCDQSGDGLLLSGFDARQPEYELKIPDGVGFAVGPQFGYDYLTLSLHVVQLENSGWTGETGIRISMVPTDNSDIPFRGMGFLTLTVRGSVPPHSVGTVCGSFHVPAVMHPISFSIHYHRYGRGGSASHIDGHGRETVFLSQNVTDPALDFSNKNFTLRPGDQLRVQCVYNNTTPETIHVL